MATENQPPEFVQYIKERDQAREQLRQKEHELVQAKSKNYELSKKCEELEQEVKELRKARLKSTKPKGSLTHTDSLNSNQKAKKKDKTITKEQKASKNPKPGTRHPVLPGHEESADNTDMFYRIILEKFPHIRLSVVLNSEKLFLEGDTNGDGLIDADELEKLLTAHAAIYTRKQIEEILHCLDVDGSNTLDFTEVLDVMHKVEEGSKTNLPPNTIQRDSKGTAVCTVQ